MMDFRTEVVDVAVKMFERSSIYTYSDGLHVLSVGNAEGGLGMTVTISTISTYGKGYAVERETVILPEGEMRRMAKAILGRVGDD